MSSIIKSASPIPKYHQFRLLLEEDIRRGRYTLGAALPPERELSEKYHISRQTVQQAMKSLVQEGWLVRMQGRGTFVARVDEKLSPVNIGVMIYGPALKEQWFFPDLLRGITDAVKVERANIIIIPFDDETPGISEGTFCRCMVEQKELHGLLVVSEELSEREICYLLSGEFPFVLTRVPPYPDRPIAYVCYNHESGVRQSIAYLHELGHTKIAYMGGQYSKYYASLRALTAFRAAMAEHGTRISPDWVVECDYSGHNAANLAHKILSGSTPPTAIIMGDDRFAAGVYKAAAMKGLSIPGDLSVIGYNDLPIAGALSPALTTIYTPRYEMGRSACEMLEEMILDTGNPAERQQELDVRLVVRDSCAPCKEA